MISVPGTRKRVIESAFTAAASGNAVSGGSGMRSKTSFRQVVASRPFDSANDGATSSRSRVVRSCATRCRFAIAVSAVRGPEVRLR